MQHKLLGLLKNSGWALIIVALPVWMVIRNLMPSETPLEYFERISRETPQFETRADNFEILRHLARLDDTTTTTLSFRHKLELANPDPAHQYFLVYKADSLGRFTRLGVVKKIAPLLGGNYRIESYHAGTDSLLFSRPLNANKRT